ncbi:hypothetical protein [Pararhizobium sp. DWP3-4]|uniref:hypothetical protein n=1 Tax=Pararhizobium sp. DWP3-4 TaxID=2804565 RepID=UPI003CEFA259
MANKAFHALSLEALATWVKATTVTVAANVVFNKSKLLVSFRITPRRGVGDREKAWQDHDRCFRVETQSAHHMKMAAM